MASHRCILRQALLAPLVQIGQFPVVQPQERQHRRVGVVDVDLVLDGP